MTPRLRSIRRTTNLPAACTGACLALALAAATPAGALQKVRASDATVSQQYGIAVAASGHRAVIGARHPADVGAAYVLRWDGSSWSEEQKLTPSDGTIGDRFGSTASVFDDLAIVGSEQLNGLLGSAYVFRFDGNAWVEEQKLVASDAQTGDYFGYAAAVRGDHALIGSPFDDDVRNEGGAVYAFRFDGNDWVEQQKITVPGTIFFGIDLALDGLGANRVLIGASHGFAYVYAFDGSSWVQEQVLSGFDGANLSRQVALFGDTALVGADTGGFGNVCAFVHDGSSWSGEQCFGAPDGFSGDDFARDDVALFEDTAVLSDEGDDQAWVFRRRSGSWEVERSTRIPGDLPASSPSYGVALGLAGSRLLVGTPGDEEAGSVTGAVYALDLAYEGARLASADSETFDRFGSAVSLDGDRVLIGVRDDDGVADGAGAALVLQRSGGDWSEEQELLASDAEEDDAFGSAVDLWGDVALIGADHEDAGGSNAGAAYVFRRSGGGWSEEQKLGAQLPAAGDFFGAAGALDGDTAAVGAHFDDDVEINSGSVTVFRHDGSSWVVEQKLTAALPEMNARLGFSLALAGDLLVAGATDADGAATDTGAAYVFRRSGTTWTQEQRLFAADHTGGEEFGHAVAVSGDVIAIGARLDDDAGTAAGSVYLYRWNGTSWAFEQEIFASDAADAENFGWSVALDGDELLVGSLRGFFLDARGAAHRFAWNGSGWIEQARFDGPDGVHPFSGDSFGIALDLQAPDVLIGSPGDDSQGIAAGVAYAFELGVCGDGVLRAVEQCDDGNAIGGDGCSALCRNEHRLALFGGASGGSVAVTVHGATVEVETQPGQTNAQVIAALAAALSASPILQSFDLNVDPDGARLVLDAPVDALDVDDAGLSPQAIPALPGAALAALFLLLAWAARSAQPASKG